MSTITGFPHCQAIELYAPPVAAPVAPAQPPPPLFGHLRAPTRQSSVRLVATAEQTAAAQAEAQRAASQPNAQALAEQAVLRERMENLRLSVSSRVSADEIAPDPRQMW